jgi:uncharacterized protein
MNLLFSPSMVKILTTVLSLFIVQSTISQTDHRELALLSKSDGFSSDFYNGSKGNDSRFMVKKSGFVLQKIPVAVSSLIMFTYQNLISGQISSGCQYAVTCSNFSKNAISEYGFIQGMLIGLDRLYRCNGATAKHTHSFERDEDGKIKESVCDIYSKY